MECLKLIIPSDFSYTLCQFIDDVVTGNPLLLVAGGVGSLGTVTDQAFVYDTVAGGWTPLNSLPFPISYPGQSDTIAKMSEEILAIYTYRANANDYYSDTFIEFNSQLHTFEQMTVPGLLAKKRVRDKKSGLDTSLHQFLLCV